VHDDDQNYHVHCFGKFHLLLTGCLSLLFRLPFPILKTLGRTLFANVASPGCHQWSRKKTKSALPSGVPAKTKSPPTEYALFNDLKKAMGNVAHWQSIVEHDPTNSKNKEELAGAVTKLDLARDAFHARPRPVQRYATEIHLTDEQRLFVRKLKQELQEELQRYAEGNLELEKQKKSFPSLEGFMRASNLDTWED
jgi:hypothetical protein